jgi:hypothetical protein
VVRSHRGVRIGEPGETELLDVRALFDDVVHQPVVHLRGARVPQHPVQVVSIKRLRAANEERDQSSGSIPCLPQLDGKVLLRLEPLRNRAELGEVDAVIVAVSLVDRACPGVLERRKFGDYLGCGCFRNHHLSHRFLRSSRVAPAYGDPMSPSRAPGISSRGRGDVIRWDDDLPEPVTEHGRTKRFLEKGTL